MYCPKQLQMSIWCFKRPSHVMGKFIKAILNKFKYEISVTRVPFWARVAWGVSGSNFKLKLSLMILILLWVPWRTISSQKRCSEGIFNSNLRPVCKTFPGNSLKRFSRLYNNALIHTEQIRQTRTRNVSFNLINHLFNLTIEL